MNKGLLVGLLGLSLLSFGIPDVAKAGNIALTGHDDDFHGSPNARAQLNGLVTFAINGSALPVLTFDSGVELTSQLTGLGMSFVNVDPNNAAAVTDALFNHSVYSAFIVASDGTCGGCDNTAAGEANIAAHATAINAFLNAGGGIVGLAGAFSPNYYAFVPQTASSVGGAPGTGYSQTAVGLALGIPAVNGDATHNLFWNPGTHGESAFYQVAEVNATGNDTILGPGAATTLVCSGCTTTGGVITGGDGGAVPEPSSLLFLGSGLVALAIALRRKLAV